VLTWLLIVAHAALLIVLVGNVVYLRRRRSRETPSAWPTGAPLAAHSAWWPRHTPSVG